MTIQDTVAVITGAAGPVGREVALEMAQRGVHGLALVDSNEAVMEVASSVNRLADDWICLAYQGSVMDESFRKLVYRQTAERSGSVNVCVPAFGGAESGLQRPLEVDELMAAIDWAMEMVNGIATSTKQPNAPSGNSSQTVTGMIFFIQLLSSIRSNGAPFDTVTADRVRRCAAALIAKADDVGIRCAVMMPDAINPASTRPSGAQPSGVLPGEVLQPNALAKAICFLISPNR
jgi:NAD(P)-dependent dehydrogenase (short-subunit alcohol dehydrogenase family)